jgi:glycine cleavage system regulatory protein
MPQWDEARSTETYTGRQTTVTSGDLIMDKQFILSILSDDKPGVVRQVAQIVSLHGGSWQESRLTQLAGKFAGVVRITLNAEQQPALRASLENLKQDGIRVQVEDVESLRQQAPTRSARFSLAGPDRPGIVLEITQALIQYQINVKDLKTHCSSMPYSGEPLFEAEGILSLPAATDFDLLNDQLNHIADNLALDIQLEEMSGSR